MPISAYPAPVAYGSKQAAALGLDVGFIGHAGDGNLHTTIFFPPDDPAVRQRAELYNDRLTRQAIALGGTCPSEHGVGSGKAKYLEVKFGPGAVALMRGIKNLLDPNGILNPGKVLPA
ncbi:MAG: hypothetical protein KJZ86_17710 [Caldilineaceae bacterium]|nr:hypothetical protein [Caldilineaceae bacterium]